MTDDPSVAEFDIGLAKVHVEICRDDVASTLVALMQTLSISRGILEVTDGSVPTLHALLGHRPLPNQAASVIVSEVLGKL